MSNIHPQAIVEPGAKIGKNVTIEPFAVVKCNVTLEDHVVIKSHAYIDGNTTIGEGTVIWPGASIGTKTQDLKFRGEKTYVVIGKRCEIREFVTINSSCQENSTVRIGDECLIMAYCHVAHNCELGNRVVMSNSAMLAGHVIVGDCAIIGGMTPVHQFSRIGCYSMVGGFSRVPRDVPPYTVGGGFPYKFGGINIIGLKRHKFPLEVRVALSKAFKLTYRSGLHLEDAISQIEKELGSHSEVQHWIDFCKNSKRGLLGLEGVANLAQNESEEQYFEE
ncbi:MAG: acyl-[acyl-carrier-protein]--UDP-N-acetylglucosamine O-acyltransferase [Chlamydiae bacterium CG10_big_fil_rev_8_21_14_0_10_42_34]|nr:MAG: acyl-[acyl-carrier-protein]--UDP-N-acetylglucosamine O-acyltransferase [Chlamydiae bacterium CG10_big_fil_rev_8_21_14_0_10_42_34]